nr:uncharacterized protein LOC109184732 [Ipomoea trifida]
MRIGRSRSLKLLAPFDRNSQPHFCAPPLASLANVPPSNHADPQLQFDEWRRLWKLPVPHKVWHDLPFAHNVSTVLLLTNALCNPSVKDVVLVMARLWMIWAVRNEVVWKGNLLRVDVLMSKATWLCNSWVSTYCRDDAAGDTSSLFVGWTPPPPHQLKCNVDVTVFEDGVGYGVVQRRTHRRGGGYGGDGGCGRCRRWSVCCLLRTSLAVEWLPVCCLLRTSLPEVDL